MKAFAIILLFENMQGLPTTHGWGQGHTDKYKTELISKRIRLSLDY